MTVETIPELIRVAERRPLNLHHQRDGRWHLLSHAELARRRRAIGRGLIELGIQKGGRVGVLADTRWEWSLTDTATLSIGAVMVGIYTSLADEQVHFLLDHPEVEVLFVENEEQMQKVRAVQDRVPSLRHVICWDGEVDGAEAFTPWLDESARLDNDDPSVFDDAVAAVGPEDLATIVYTSGTTGFPKGAELTHRALAIIGTSTSDILEIQPDDVAVAFLPLAHVLTRVGAYSATWAGVTSYLAQSPLHAAEAFQKANPSVFAVVPRVFEKVHATILAKVQTASPIKQQLFKRAIATGDEVARRQREGLGVPRALKLKHKLAERLVLSKLRAAIFGNRARQLNSGGAPISAELLEFFHAMGILVLEGYGLTETSSPCTLNTPKAYRFGTVGQAMPGCEIKIADDGEVLIKSPGLFRGYYKDEDATAEAFTEDGFFRSGDIGALDDDGYLSITGRKKEIIVTAQGKNIAPAPIENKIKEHALISQVVLIGDQRPYITALITVDDEIAPLWAERQGVELNKEAITKEVATRVDEVNTKLARFEQIKRFEVLDEDFSIEQGTLTPSLKVKRPVVAKRYSEVIDALYSATT